MGEHGAGRGHPHVGAKSNETVAKRNGDVAEENSETQSRLVLAGPSCRYQGPHQCPETSSTQQDAHAEHRSTRRIDTATVDGKLAGAHHRKNDPTGPDH